MQNAKRKVQNVGTALQNYNLTNLELCRGRSPCLPVVNRKSYGRARRTDPTLQPIWCIGNHPDKFNFDKTLSGSNPFSHQNKKIRPSDISNGLLCV